MLSHTMVHSTTSLDECNPTLFLPIAMEWIPVVTAKPLSSVLNTNFDRFFINIYFASQLSSLGD